MSWKAILKAHYTAPPDISLRQFRLGLSLFFCGMVALFGAHQLMEPSLRQEIVVLLALMILGSGFIIAMMAQVRLIITRLWRFFASRDKDSSTHS